MNILINCSNLKKGGGLQVGDSICQALREIKIHNFIVILSSFMDNTFERIKGYENVSIIRHDIKNDFKTLILGRDKLLDEAVINYNIDVVLTIFGPSRWNPKCKHLCGFARAQIIMSNSPYYKQMSFRKKLKELFINKIWDFYFRRGANTFYTENPLTTEMLKRHWPKKTIHTVTNYYNQIFDEPSRWVYHNLNIKKGTTFLSVTSSGNWKNLGIIKKICSELNKIDSHFEFKFVLTINSEQYGPIPDEIADRFEFLGPVQINELPSLYKQADILFQPSLLECFTATYPEAMRMGIPIVTTDLDFARGLCGRAAEYYSPMNPKEAAKALYRVTTDTSLREKLIENGRKQLRNYNTYEERANKLISICESLL